MDKLKKCPFCGGEAVTHVNNGVSVICTMCGAHSKTLVDSYSQGNPTGRAVDKVVKRKVNSEFKRNHPHKIIIE